MTGPLLRALAVCLIAPCGAVYALDPRKAITQYQQSVWTLEAGLPQSSVLATAQTADGYLWFATEEGLTRYDGTRFTVFDRGTEPEMPSNFVRALAAAPDGTLWIGTSRGLCRSHGGRISAMRLPAGRDEPDVSSLLVSRSGQVWVGTTGGLYRLDGAGWKHWIGGADRPVNALAEDRDGTIWAGTENGLLRIGSGGPEPVSSLSSKSITALAASRDGTLWAGVASAGVLRRRGGHFERVWAVPEDSDVRSILEDRHGSIWMCLHGVGLLRLAAEREELYSAAQGLPAKGVNTLHEDREGNLWIGTAQFGLICLRDTPFLQLGARESLTDASVWGILESRDGSIWMGSSNGVVRWKDGAFVRFGAGTPFGANAAYGLAQSGDGTIWIGAAGGKVVSFRDGKFSSRVLPEFAGKAVVFLASDRDGSVWFGTRRRSLVQVTDGHFAVSEPPTIHDGTVSTLAPAMRGGVWVGDSQGGLILWQCGKLTATHRLLYRGRVARASAIHEDASGALWVGTDIGVLFRHFQNRWTAWGPTEGLTTPNIWRILEDAAGNLWMSSNRGLYAVAKSELESWSAGEDRKVEERVFGVSDGLRTQEFDGGPTPAGAKVGAQFWLPTVRGVVVFNPAELGRPGTAAIPVIEQALWNQRAFSGAAKLPWAGRGELQVRYTAPRAFGAGLQFRYKLEGYDTDWFEAGTRRDANYSGIPPRDYVFRVQVRDQNGDWNLHEATLSFSLPPPFYSQPWFYTLAGSLLIGSVLISFTWHVRRLISSNRELEQKVRERTSALERATQAAESAVRARSAFLATMSHEIRTPMNGILGLIAALEDASLAPEARHDLEMARSAGESLRRVLNDVLDYSKIESGKLDLEKMPVDAGGCVQRCAGLFERTAADKGLALRVEIAAGLPSRVLTDETRLSQILANLVNNAVKFTSSGEVVVSATARRAASDSWELAFAVRDTGVGIAPEAIPELFQAFHQVDASTSRRFGGTGLGLAICKRLVELMGGRIWAESQMGSGSTFRFTILAAEATAPEPAPQAGAERILAGLRMLLVEDNSINRVVGCRLLGKLAAKPALAADAFEALRMTLETDYDIVFMDIQMPGMDGLEATRQIRQRRDRRQPVVVALTANADDGIRRACFDAGMDDYVTKPITAASLAACVHRWAPCGGPPGDAARDPEARAASPDEGCYSAGAKRTQIGEGAET